MSRGRLLWVGAVFALVLAGVGVGTPIGPSSVDPENRPVSVPYSAGCGPIVFGNDPTGARDFAILENGSFLHQSRSVNDFLTLLRRNRNYRYSWLGQIVSEIGDHFNTIAVFSLALETTGSGMVVSTIMLARAVPMILAGPIAGVALDRMDRKKLMIVSDVVRGVVGAAFIWTVGSDDILPLYLFSGLLMFASPFFTSGRTAILPTIASPEELHTANSLTQTTKYVSVTLGTLLGGVSAASLGYEAAFLINSASFFFSAAMIAMLRLEKGDFRPKRKALTEQDVARPWHEYVEGLRYLRGKPLMFGIALLHVGWATGGGAAQILFSLFGEVVFVRGASGIGMIWSAAGLGLLVGATYAHWLGKRVGFEAYKRVIAICHCVHGLSYVCFSQAPTFGWAMFFVGLSRAGVGVTSVLNQEQLLRHVGDEYRGRVYSTIESMTWGTMMLSLTAAGWASESFSPRTIGAWAGAFSTVSGLIWALANWRGKLPEPTVEGVDPEDIEVRSQPRM